MTPELERWLTERFERERRALLEVVTAVVKDLLAEHMQRDAEARREALDQEFAKLQSFIDQMRNLTERMARLDRDARDESVSPKVN